MGRWAQRQRTGGGINTPIQIVSVDREGAYTLRLHYNRDINDVPFDPTMFSTFPGAEIADTVGVDSETDLEVTFLHSVAGDTKLTFEGAIANVVSPQTVNL